MNQSKQENSELQSLEYKYFVAELCFKTTDDEERQDEYFEEMYQIGELIDQVKYDMRHNPRLPVQTIEE